MKLWDWTVYMILVILLLDVYKRTNSAGYLIILGGLLIAYGRKYWGDLK